MDVRLRGKDAGCVSLPDQIAAVTQQLARDQKLWREELRRDPSRFGDVEVAVHQTFQHLADQVVTGLLADVGQQSSLEDACKKSR